MMTVFKVGDKVRILDASKIAHATRDGFNTGGIYTVDYVRDNGTPHLKNNNGNDLYFYVEELRYIELANTKYTTEKRKANVGERILITKAFDAEGEYDNGDVFTIDKSFSAGVFVKENRSTAMYHNEYEVIVAEKPSKSARISQLESKVAELEAKVAALQKPKETTVHNVTINATSDVSVSAFAESLTKRLAELTSPKPTPNQQRKAVIERAKAFVGQRQSYGGRRVEFVVNADKRTVVALISRVAFRGERNGIYAKAIAKCAPDDVFNADIGKAIALGRALDLDVGEFENAVKPTEVVVGMIVAGKGGGYYNPRRHFTLVSRSTESEGAFLYAEKTTDWIERYQIGVIIDDTAAQY